MKTVIYEGVEFLVNKSAKFIAADSDGTVFTYTQEPTVSSDGSAYCYDWNSGNRCVEVGKITMRNMLKEI